MGSSFPVNSLRNVDFPAPLSPISAILESELTAKLRFSKMIFSGEYPNLTFSSENKEPTSYSVSGNLNEVFFSSLTSSTFSIFSSALIRD